MTTWGRGRGRANEEDEERERESLEADDERKGEDVGQKRKDRAKDSPMNLNTGAFSTGVILNKLLAQAAPSGSLVVTGGRFCAMTLLSGRARPRRPLKLDERGSLST